MTDVRRQGAGSEDGHLASTAISALFIPDASESEEAPGQAGVWVCVGGGGCYEYVARRRMMAQVKDGGRDVPHLPLRLDGIFVAHLLKQRLGVVEQPTGYFLRLHSRRLLQWSNLGPHAEQLPWHYRHAAKWVRANPEALDREVGPDPKRLYTAVRGRATAGPVVGVPPAVWITD